MAKQLKTIVNALKQLQSIENNKKALIEHIVKALETDVNALKTNV